MTNISVPKELVEHARKIAAEHLDVVHGEGHSKPFLNRQEAIEAMTSMFVQGWIDWALAQYIMGKKQ